MTACGGPEPGPERPPVSIAETLAGGSDIGNDLKAVTIRRVLSKPGRLYALPHDILVKPCTSDPFMVLASPATFGSPCSSASPLTTVPSQERARLHHPVLQVAMINIPPLPRTSLGYAMGSTPVPFACVRRPDDHRDRKTSILEPFPLEFGQRLAKVRVGPLTSLGHSRPCSHDGRNSGSCAHYCSSSVTQATPVSPPVFSMPAVTHIVYKDTAFPRTS